MSAFGLIGALVVGAVILVFAAPIIYEETVDVEQITITTQITDIKYAGGGFANPQKTILFTDNGSYKFMGVVTIDMNRLVRISYSYHNNGEYCRLKEYEYIGG